MLKINIVVCGKFHYDKYSHHLGDCLDKVYFSHKPKSFGKLAASKKSNHSLKEYMLGLHLKILKEFALDVCLPFYHRVWESSVLSSFEPSDANIFLLHGNSKRIIKKCRDMGKIVIGEAVNLHPHVLDQRLKNEASTLGLPYKSVVSKKIVDESLMCDFILTPSEGVAKSYIEAGISESKIITIPYGSAGEVKINCRPYHSGSKIRVLCVGQIMLRKGQHRLLAELNDTSKYDVTLVGREHPDYMNKIREIGTPFKHIRHVEHSKLIKMMSEYDVLVVPSIEDGFAMVALEALSSGTPVVISCFAGASEVIKKCGGGVVYDPLIPGDLIQKLEQVASGEYKPSGIPIPTWQVYANNLISEISCRS